VMTHLHADHASGLREFPGATVALGKREWEGPRGALAGYSRRQLETEADYRLLDFDADGVPCDGFERTLDLFGDGSVLAADTPGHSPGHLSLILRLASGPALLSGDAIFTLGELRGEAEPWRIADRRRYRDSLAQLRRFARRRPDALIVPGHEMATWQTLAPVY
jgi:N-acyl homoserine lactone hydrolase